MTDILKPVEQSPLRFDFTSADQLSRFSYTSTDINSSFEVDNGMLSAQSYSEFEAGYRLWLTSPKIDLSSASDPYMTAEVYYFGDSGISDHLNVLASVDNGQSFEYLLDSKWSSNLSDFNLRPESEIDFEKGKLLSLEISLEEFAGVENLLISFQSNYSEWNKIFIDRIEFYNSSQIFNQEMAIDEISIYPNPSYDNSNIIFNLSQKQDIRLAITSISGAIFEQKKLIGVLNQSYKIDTNNLPNGLYIVQVTGKTILTSTRLIVNK
jgi:hypothetical protein